MSTSKSRWACLMTETPMPSALKYGIRRASSVVLPAPLHPARPITFILFSGTSSLTVIARSQRVRPFGRPDDRLRDEAIQFLAASLDCFAALAMTIRVAFRLYSGLLY